MLIVLALYELHVLDKQAHCILPLGQGVQAGKLQSASKKQGRDMKLHTTFTKEWTANVTGTFRSVG